MNWIYTGLGTVQVGSQKTTRVLRTVLAGVIGLVIGIVQMLVIMGIVMATTDYGETTEQVVRGSGFQTTVLVQNEPSGLVTTITIISVLALLVLPFALALWYWFRSAPEFKAPATA